MEPAIRLIMAEMNGLLIRRGGDYVCNDVWLDFLKRVAATGDVKVAIYSRSAIGDATAQTFLCGLGRVSPERLEGIQMLGVRSFQGSAGVEELITVAGVQPEEAILLGSSLFDAELSGEHYRWGVQGLRYFHFVQGSLPISSYRTEPVETPDDLLEKTGHALRCWLEDRVR